MIQTLLQVFQELFYSLLTADFLTADLVGELFFVLCLAFAHSYDLLL